MAKSSDDKKSEPEEEDAPKLNPITMTGYLVFACSLVIFLIVAWRVLSGDSYSPIINNNSIISLLGEYFPDFLLLFIGVFLSFIGFKLFGKSTDAIQKTIPDEDRRLLEPLISQGNEEAVKLYVILSGLSGVSGFFQQIGFAGLPLVTAALTLIFSALAFAPDPLGENFLELAKLTLGAFIGSFVQKGVEPPKIAVSKPEKQP